MRFPTVAATALVLAAATATAAPLRAQVVVYTDLASFLGATTAVATDGFDDLAPGERASPLARTAGAYAFTVTANTTSLFVVGPDADRWLSTNTATDVLTVAGFAPAVRAVGGLFFGTDDLGAFRPGTAVTVRAFTASGVTVRTLGDATTATFLGFVGDEAITALEVEVASQTSGLAWPTVNALVLGQAAPTSVVPEPRTIALVGAGLVALVGGGRRRRA